MQEINHAKMIPASNLHDLDRLFATVQLKAQDEAGVDVHQVEIEATDPAEFERIVAKLL